MTEAVTKKKRLPIGIDDFVKVRTGNYYYVDKSLFIKDLLDSGAAATLVPRPRRFGKTLNISMVQNFFEKSINSRRELFNGLAIEHYPDCMEHQGKYPVIFLTFKNIKQMSWEISYDKLKSAISAEVTRHLPAIESVLTTAERTYINGLIAGSATQGHFEDVLVYLPLYLERAYGSKVILLLDEYDAPIHAGFTSGYYDQVISFMRGFLGGGLKGNNSVEFSVMTGILRVAKESIFSGVNNLRGCTLIADGFSDKFGLTETEVEAGLRFFNIESKLTEIRDWYNGYSVGQIKIYNPWSILNFFDNGGLPHPYWVNTSDNMLIQDLVKNAPVGLKDDVELLMRGGTVKKQIQDNITLTQLTYDQSVFWNFLLFCGYLTFENYRQEGIFQFADLKIPNNEVLSVYHTFVLSWFKAPGIHEDYLTMLTKLIDGNAADFKYLFEKFSQEALSNFDITEKEPEKFYHALTIGMFAALYFTHEVRSNRESGLGRYDVVLIPKDSTKPGIIVEFKKIDKNSKKKLPAVAKEALAQIAAKNYEVDLRARGITTIIKLGVAFKGKESFVLIGPVTSVQNIP